MKQSILDILIYVWMICMMMLFFFMFDSHAGVAIAALVAFSLGALFGIFYVTHR